MEAGRVGNEADYGNMMVWNSDFPWQLRDLASLISNRLTFRGVCPCHLVCLPLKIKNQPTKKKNQYFNTRTFTFFTSSCVYESVTVIDILCKGHCLASGWSLSLNINNQNQKQKNPNIASEFTLCPPPPCLINIHELWA